MAAVNSAEAGVRPCRPPPRRATAFTAMEIALQAARAHVAATSLHLSMVAVVQKWQRCGSARLSRSDW